MSGGVELNPKGQRTVKMPSASAKNQICKVVFLLISRYPRVSPSSPNSAVTARARQGAERVEFKLSVTIVRKYRNLKAYLYWIYVMLMFLSCQRRRNWRKYERVNSAKQDELINEDFRDWLVQCRVRLDSIPKMLKDLEEFHKNDWNYVLKIFFCGGEKVDGSCHPSETLTGIAAMLQLYFRESFKWKFSNSKTLNFFLQKVWIHKWRGALDIILTKPRKKAETMSNEDG